MSVLTNLKGTISGSVDKAILCVKKPAKPNGAEGYELGTVDIATNGMVVPKGYAKENMEVELRKRLMDKRKGKAILDLHTSNRKIANEYGFHTLQVKYNPSKLRLSAHGGGQFFSAPSGEGNRNEMQSTAPAEITLQVELLFDDVNPQDAFMWDKFTNTSSAAVVSNVSGVVKTVKQGGYSVQSQIEALIALVTQADAKQVVFIWGDTIFAGEVLTIDAKYTMFNPLGHPVRGTVALTIGEFDGKKGSRVVDKNYWMSAYEEMLESNSLFRKAGNSVGNLLNLK